LQLQLKQHGVDWS